MRKLRVRYPAPAQNDLIEILEYIKLDNPENAVKFVAAVEKRVGVLESFLNAGVVPKDKVLKRKKYRILVCDTYLVFYKLTGKTAWIHRVLHGKRKYEHLL